MVTLSKIIEGLEMVDDIVDCYYNPHKDEIFFNEFGVPEKRYVEPKDFVEFIPNKNFIELLNGQRITTMSKKALMKE